MITIVRAVQTCYACPSQWDAWDADGNEYYLRYRWGGGEVHPVGSDGIDWTVTLAEFDTGDLLDGSIDLEEFASQAGMLLALDRGGSP